MNIMHMPIIKHASARSLLLASLVAVTGASAGVAAATLSKASLENAVANEVRTAIKLRLPKTPIDAIDCQHLGGLCEIVSKRTLFYVDRTARYLVVGRVYDMDARQDLTAARLLELNPGLLAAGGAKTADAEPGPPAHAQRAADPEKVDIAALKGGAIHWGPVNGPKIIVLSDFHCSYCKRLSGELKKLGARVEEHPISIFGAESRKLSESVLCATDPALALHAAYDGKPVAPSHPCPVAGLDANEAFAKAHGFGGTPVLIRPSDGAVLEGYRDAGTIAAFLAAAPKGR